MDYVDFYFCNIVHKLIQKDDCMMEMEKLNYDNPSKDQKKTYSKKEDRHVRVAEEARKSSDDAPCRYNTPRGNKEKEDLRLPLPPKVMYEDYLQRGLLETSPIKEIEDDDSKIKWYNENAYYLYHQVKGHMTNDCIELRKNLQKFIDCGKINYDPNDNEDCYESSEDGFKLNNINATISQESPSTISYS